MTELYVTVLRSLHSGPVQSLLAAIVNSSIVITINYNSEPRPTVFNCFDVTSQLMLKIPQVVGLLMMLWLRLPIPYITAVFYIPSVYGS